MGPVGVDLYDEWKRTGERMGKMEWGEEEMCFGMESTNNGRPPLLNLIRNSYIIKVNCRPYPQDGTIQRLY